MSKTPLVKTSFLPATSRRSRSVRSWASETILSFILKLPGAKSAINAEDAGEFASQRKVVFLCALCGILCDPLRLTASSIIDRKQPLVYLRFALYHLLFTIYYSRHSNDCPFHRRERSDSGAARAPESSAGACRQRLSE